MKAVRIAAIALVVAAAGCGSNGTASPVDLRDPPTPAPAHVAVKIYTHCGIRWAQFDGKSWVADPPLGDGNGNPPPGWGNPFQDGVVTVDGDHATFVGSGGQRATFRLATATDSPPPICS